MSNTKSTNETEEMIQIESYKKGQKRLYSDTISPKLETVSLKKGNAFIDNSFHPKMQYLDKPSKGIFDLMDIQTITTLDLDGVSDSDDTLLERPRCHVYSALTMTTCTDNKASSVATRTTTTKRSKLQIAINKQKKYSKSKEEESDGYSDTSEESVSESSVINDRHGVRRQRRNKAVLLDVDELRHKLMKVIREDGHRKKKAHKR